MALPVEEHTFIGDIEELIRVARATANEINELGDALFGSHPTPVGAETDSSSGRLRDVGSTALDLCNDLGAARERLRGIGRQLGYDLSRVKQEAPMPMNRPRVG